MHFFIKKQDFLKEKVQLFLLNAFNPVYASWQAF